MTNENRLLLALVARGGVMVETTPVGRRSVHSAQTDGSRFADWIHRGLLDLLDAGHLDVGPGGHLRLTTRGTDILRGLA